MPYIKQQARKDLDPLIDTLASEIAAQTKSAGDDTALAGLLNYTCTRLALKTVKLRLGTFHYWVIALISGVFKNVSDEFYRRLAGPYEDKQILKNGDVDLYEGFEVELRKPEEQETVQ
jgi:hypothetical protein